MKLAAGLAVMPAAARAISPASDGARPAVCLFSKPLPNLDYGALGKALHELRFTAVDLTVRPKGHVLPERAPQDLPVAVHVLREHGVEVAMITTGLNTTNEPAAQPILSAAGALGIRYFKPGYYRYTDLKRLHERIAETREQVRGLVELGSRNGMVLGFHNHSGEGNVGAALWDESELLRDLDPKWAGSYFDPCHAVIEGGLSGWEVNFHLLAPRIKMLAVKDFYWEKRAGKWAPRFCPLGEGMVPWKKFFKLLAGSRFAGPISLHVEYELPADPLPAIARDLAFLNARLTEAYG